MKGIPLRLLILALLLEALFLSLFRAAETGEIVTAVVILLLAGSAWLIAVYWIHQLPTNAAGPPFLFILAAALLFRLTLFPLSYPVTDDAYRYRWEGKLQAHGGNPYQTRPSDPEWAFLRDSTYSRVGLKEFKGGYGPAWEIVSLVTYKTLVALVPDEQSQVFWFKVPALLGDLGLLAALAALLRALSLPPPWILTYAWAPLPVWEFWANGHQDSLVVLAVVIALISAAQRKPWRATSALVVASALKFWPAILFPAFARAGVRARHLLVCLPFFALFALPYWSGVTENIRFMSGFVGGWRNNDSLFGAILWLAGDQYRAKYTAFALIGLLAVVIVLRQPDLPRAVLWTITGMLFIASNCHPWYLTWLLPLLAIEANAGLLLWTALVPLFYSVWPAWVATGIWEGVTPFRWFIYVPVFALLAGDLIYEQATKRRLARVT